MLWFSDDELGIRDPYTRKALLKFCEQMDWDACGENVGGGIKYKTKKNGDGLGREHAPAPPPAKRRKVTATAVVAPEGSIASDVLGLSKQNKVAQRVKTLLQLHLTKAPPPLPSSPPSSSFTGMSFVVSGATNMKKIGQLCAFLTGNASTYHHHSQKGKNIKGSKIVLRKDNGAKTVLWLAGKAMSKKATQEGAGFLEDKTVKVVEVFQGLCTGVDSGVQYDTNEAKSMNSGNNVVFQVPTSSSSSSSSSSSLSSASLVDEYVLTAEGIFPNKCMREQGVPLPRIVTPNYYPYNGSASVGFGMNLHRANSIMQGKRQGPRLMFVRGESQRSVNQACQQHQSKPLCDQYGHIQSMFGGKDLTYDRMYWNDTNVATASPP